MDDDFDQRTRMHIVWMEAGCIAFCLKYEIRHLYVRNEISASNEK